MNLCLSESRFSTDASRLPSLSFGLMDDVGRAYFWIVSFYTKAKVFLNMHPVGLEPTTGHSLGGCSIQLSYGCTERIVAQE